MVKKISILFFIALFSFTFSNVAISAERKAPAKKVAVKKPAKTKESKKSVSKPAIKPPAEMKAPAKKAPIKVSDEMKNERFLNKVVAESVIPTKALMNLEFKCNENEPMACYYLAQYYLNKIVIDNISRQPDFKPKSRLKDVQITENIDKAAKYLNYACSEYVYEACTDLAKLNLEADSSKFLTNKKPTDVSIDFLRRSCENNLASACAYLGDLSSEGKYEKKSASQAFKYYAKGCSLQDSVACHNLALSYYKGWGVGIDHELAYLYMDKACKMKNMEACKALKNN